MDATQALTDLDHATELARKSPRGLRALILGDRARALAQLGKGFDARRAVEEGGVLIDRENVPENAAFQYRAGTNGSRYVAVWGKRVGEDGSYDLDRLGFHDTTRRWRMVSYASYTAAGLIKDSSSTATPWPPGRTLPTICLSVWQTSSRS